MRSFLINLTAEVLFISRLFLFLNLISVLVDSSVVLYTHSHAAGDITNVHLDFLRSIQIASELEKFSSKYELYWIGQAMLEAKNLIRLVQVFIRSFSDWLTRKPR